jgi:hypothetical protein
VHDADVRRLSVLLVLALGAGCADPAGPAVLDGATMITYVDDSGASMAALGRGTLVVESGCVAMANDWGPPTFVLWPSTFGLQRGEHGIEVIDGSGNLVAGVGEPVELGGGYVHLRHAESFPDARVPEDCRVRGERYFVASGGAGVELDGVTLLRGRSDRPSTGAQVVEGRLGERNGCVSILDDDGNGPYLVSPMFHHLTGGPNEFHLVDADGEVLATLGTTVRLVGEPRSVEDPRSLPGGIPGSCREDGAAYWFVGEIDPD